MSKENIKKDLLKKKLRQGSVKVQLMPGYDPMTGEYTIELCPEKKYWTDINFNSSSFRYDPQVEDNYEPVYILIENYQANYLLGKFQNHKNLDGIVTVIMPLTELDRLVKGRILKDPGLPEAYLTSFTESIKLSKAKAALEASFLG